VLDTAGVGHACGESATAHLSARFFLEGGVARQNKGEGIRERHLKNYIAVLRECLHVAAGI
jgi:hypothetical protein